jgi:hypothetical protein
MRAFDPRSTITALLATTLAAAPALTQAAASSTAFAVIDWSTLNIDVIGPGALVPQPDVLFLNSALTTDTALGTTSNSQQFFLPAAAGNPAPSETGALAFIEDDKTHALAGSTDGIAAARSSAHWAFATVGHGTAVISVNYALGAEVLSDAPVDSAARSEVTLGADITNFAFSQLGSGGARGATATAFTGLAPVADLGILTLTFDFFESAAQFVFLEGTVSALAVTASAVPIPAAGPLLVAALAALGCVRRRNSR